MSYRTTRAFERPPAIPPDMIVVVSTFGREFKRMIDERAVRGIYAVGLLLLGRHPVDR